MLARHSALYFLARGVPGLVNFATLALYTHLLPPREYGYYALVIAAVSLIELIGFSWLRLCVYRFFSGSEHERLAFLSTVADRFIRIALLVGLTTAVAAIAGNRVFPAPLILLGGLLLCSQAWLELNLAVVGAGLRPLRFGAMCVIKAVTSLVAGGLFALWTHSAVGCVIGLTLGTTLAASPTFAEWRGVRRRYANPTIAKRLATFGLPLAGTAAFALAVLACGRMFLAYFNGPDDAGLFSVPFDIAQQTVFMLMSAINLAAYPIAVQILERDGIQAARQQLRSQATALLIIGVPAATGLAMLADSIADLFVGNAFAPMTAALLPPLSFAILIGAIKMLYFDLSFQLGNDTRRQLTTGAISAVVTVVANFVGVLAFGIAGAVYAAIASFTIGLVLTTVRGRTVFPLPFPFATAAKVVLASAVMAVGLTMLPRTATGIGLATHTAIGGVLYGTIIFALDVASIQLRVRRAAHHVRLLRSA